MPLRRPIAPTAFAAAIAALSGCYYPGGPGASYDVYTYESTSWKPWTVTLVDTRTGQTVWSIDVPVGKEVVLSFKEGEGTKDSATPDLMRWQLFPLGTHYGELKSTLAVPPASARRLDPVLRPTPELPEEMTAAPAPSKPPVFVTPDATTQPK